MNEQSDHFAIICRAMTHHQRGELTEARTLYEQILRSEPANADALNLSGVICLQTGDPRRALELIDQAVELAPSNAVAHFNRGVALQALGRLEVALYSYERAIAVDAGLAPAHLSRGVVLRDLGRLEAALASLDRAIAISGEWPEAHFNRGLVLERLGKPDLAVTSYDRAISFRPGYEDAWYNRGNALRVLALGASDRLEEAIASYDRAIAANPLHAAAYVNRGNILKDLGRLHAALADYNHAAALIPGDADVERNRGVLLYECHRLGEAIASFDKALALRPELAPALHYRGYAHLLAGDFEKGWADHEWRWKNEEMPIAVGRRQFAQPWWLGDADVAGKRILIHCEQGLGDTLQFCRYVKSVADLGATVFLETPAALAGLLESLEGPTRVVVQGAELPQFDYHSSLMSLPLAFRTTLSTIPASVPYLRCDPRKVHDWKSRLGVSRKLRVGLVWSGGFRPEQPELWPVNRRRNIPLVKLGVLKHCEVEFYSLQKGEPAESELSDLIARRWAGPDIINFTGELNDFSDTAALTENLDLVITVDTAVAHLAAALGRPVWLMNRFDTCWRWLLNRSDSPWYPTLRLYRQERPGDWDGVVRRIRVDLEALIRSHGPVMSGTYAAQHSRSAPRSRPL